MSDEIDDTPAPPSQLPAALRKAGFILLLLFAAWLLFAQVVPRLFLPHASETATAPVAQHHESLDDILKARDERIAALEQKIDALATAAPAQSDDDRFKRLENDLAAANEAIAALKTHIETLQSETGHRLAILMAFHAMKDAALHGDAFKPALDQLARLTMDNADMQKPLSQLAPLATQGVPTLAALQASFERALPDALSPAADSGALMRHLHGLIRIRKTGDQPGNSDEAILARAESALSRGDLQGALGEMDGLSPQAAEAFAAWVEAARSYLVADHALATLEAALPANEAAPSPAVPAE